MGSNTTPVLRRMSLRRAIWRARMTAKALRDTAEITGAERLATDMLRASVKQQLKSEPVGDFEQVYAVRDDWRSQVLQRDPQVVCAHSVEDVLEALEGDEPVEVLATRETALTVERLRDLCQNAPRTMQGKTVFIET